MTNQKFAPIRPLPMRRIIDFWSTMQYTKLAREGQMVPTAEQDQEYKKEILKTYVIAGYDALDKRLWNEYTGSVLSEFMKFHSRWNTYKTSILDHYCVDRIPLERRQSVLVESLFKEVVAEISPGYTEPLELFVAMLAINGWRATVQQLNSGYFEEMDHPMTSALVYFQGANTDILDTEAQMQLLLEFCSPWSNESLYPRIITVKSLQAADSEVPEQSTDYANWLQLKYLILTITPVFNWTQDDYTKVRAFLKNAAQAGIDVVRVVNLPEAVKATTI